MALQRRDLLRWAAAGSLAAVTACSGGEEPAPDPPAETPKFSGPFGVQLYTLRGLEAEQIPQALIDLAKIGYEEIEAVQAAWASQSEAAKAAGLRPVSMHLKDAVVSGEWGDSERLEHHTVQAAADWAAGFGFKWLVMPYLPADQRGSSLDSYKALAEKLNRAGKIIKANGMGFAYHNHSFEFEPMGDSTPLATLMAETDPELVQLELDVFWVSVAGSDPADTIRQYGRRSALLHLKDKAAETPASFETAPHEAFKEVGNGSIDFNAVLEAGAEVGTQHCFVEQDQTPDPLESLRQSYSNLRALTA